MDTVFSYQEKIDITAPTHELIFHVMASLISQRVKADMARVKAQGNVFADLHCSSINNGNY